MKILQVFDCYGIPKARALPGGENGSVATVVYYLSKYLVKKGCDVTILERDLGFLPKEEYIDGIRYCRIPSKGLPAHPYKLINSPVGLSQLFLDGVNVAKKVNKVLKFENYDIVHFHFPIALSFLMGYNKKLGKQLVYTLHAGEVRLGLNKNSPSIVKYFSPDVYLMKRIRKTIVLNNNLKNKLIEKNIAPDKLEVIPNGIDVNEFRQLYSENLCYRSDSDNIIKILYVGKIIPRKGIKILLKAIRRIVESGIENFKLLVVGDTQLDPLFYENLVNFVKVNKLSKFVEFKGFVSYEKLIIFYSECDIFVLPSIEEGFGMVLAEALCFGKPVIGTKVGGVPMQIQNNWNGFLVEPENDKQLAEKIVYLLKNEDVRKKMGRNSKKLVEEFDWKKITEKYLYVYKEVLNEC